MPLGSDNVFSIETFKHNIAGQGARPTLFNCVISFSGSNTANDTAGVNNFQFTCKTASLPGRAIGTIELPYFGRKLKVAGDATWEPWTVTIINDESFAARDMFVKWMELINDSTNNIRTNYPYLEATAKVTQYAKSGDQLKSFEMVECWPSDLAAIEVAWDQNDNWEEYQVTLQYQYWTDTTPGTVITQIPSSF